MYYTIRYPNSLWFGLLRYNSDYFARWQITLLEYIDDSSSGDEVWIKGYADNTIYHQKIGLKDGVSVKGGFLGAYNGDVSRDMSENPSCITVISGQGLNDSVVVASNGVGRTTVIEYCTIRDGAGRSGRGGGICCTSAAPTIRHCRITSNSAGYGGGIFADINSAPDIEDCSIDNNNSSGASFAYGVGMYWYSGICINTKIYLNNVIMYNQSSNTGSGVYLTTMSSTQVFANNTVVNNTGGMTPCGIYIGAATNPSLYNNIIANNSTYGIYKNSGSYNSYNNCYFGNGNNYNIAPTVSSSDVLANPDFATDGYHLALGSPCINAGNDTIVQSGWVDVDGEARQSATTVDIGADEYTPLTVTINQASNQADPTNTNPVNFTVVFSDSVTGLTLADVTISGAPGATKTITGSGTTYNIAVALPAATGALLVASIPAGVAQNSSLAWNSASTSTDNAVLFLNPPTEVEVQATGTHADNSGKLTIYWKSVPGATGYNIYRGTTSGAENYQNPINGSTPWNTPSFTNSTHYAFTDTGLTFGQTYFYTVKAVLNDEESAASSEDYDIPDPYAIPWDSNNPDAITNAIIALAGVSPTFTRALGPDGTVYCSQTGVLHPGGLADLGTYNPIAGLLQYTDGTSLAVPDDGSEEDQSGFQVMMLDTSSLKASDGPYRRVRSKSTFTGSYGYFAPGDQNNIYLSSVYTNDTYWTYLGSRSSVNSTALDIDAGLQWSRVHYSYKPCLWVQKKDAISHGVVTRRFLAPQVQPIRFISSYPYYYISLNYALQPFQYSSKAIPMLLIGGYDGGLDFSTVLLAAANPVNTKAGMMKRAHSIAQGMPKYCRATGSYFEFAAFGNGLLRDGAGQWVTWTDSEDVTADEGSYPLRPATVQWTNPYGNKFFEEYGISIYANYTDPEAQ